MVKYIILILLFTINILWSENIKGLYDEFFKPGAESKGFVNSLIASDDGFITIFYNPANIGLMQNKIEFYFSQENHFLINEISHLTTGLIFNYYNLPALYAGLSWRKLNFVEAVGYEDNENILMATTGIKIHSLCFGVNWKYFYSSLNSIFIQSISRGYGIDTGINYSFKRIIFGVSILNLYANLNSDEKKIKYKSHFGIGAKYFFLKNLFIYATIYKSPVKYIFSTAFNYKLKYISFSTGISSKKEIGLGIYLLINKFFIKYGYSLQPDENINKNSISFLFQM